MMAIGHSILGDRFYADDDALVAADRLQLHAEELVLRHPVGGAEMRFSAEVPF
jgi:tRNA pseudouridine32 synthase/23S rRNA pseudouridine746 synthase